MHSLFSEQTDMLYVAPATGRLLAQIHFPTKR